jgi:Tfp pilus assembly protein PilX
MESEGSAKPRGITLIVVIIVVLAVIFAWLLGFFTWLLS